MLRRGCIGLPEGLGLFDTGSIRVLIFFRTLLVVCRILDQGSVVMIGDDWSAQSSLPSRLRFKAVGREISTPRVR